MQLIVQYANLVVVMLKIEKSGRVKWYSEAKWEYYTNYNNYEQNYEKNRNIEMYPKDTLHCIVNLMTVGLISFLFFFWGGGATLDTS
jgi:hypothetical protein